MGKFIPELNTTDRVDVFLIVNNITYEEWQKQIWKYMLWNGHQITQYAKETNKKYSFTGGLINFKNEEYQDWLENKYKDILNSK